MDFAYTAEQLQVAEAVGRICGSFDAEYWLARDSDGLFPHDFHRAMAQGGWLGIACLRNTAALAWAFRPVQPCCRPSIARVRACRARRRST